MAKSKLVHFRFLFYPFLAFLFGIAMARKLFAADVFTIVAVVLCFAALATALFIFGKWKSFLIMVVVFLLGNGAYFLGLEQNKVKVYAGEVTVVGRVSDKFLNEDGQYRFYLDDVLVEGKSSKSVYMYIFTDDDKIIEVGDKLVFTTELALVKPFELGEFQNSVVRENCGYMAAVYTSDVEVVGSHIKFDEAFRMRVRSLLHANMSDENAEVSYAVLFGDKMGVESDVKAFYRDAGILHILTVSGLHVGFLIAFIYYLLRLCKLKRLPTTIVTGVILLLYNILCGFTPSVMRASIMALVIMLAKLSGREYDNPSSLGLAGFIILFINPLYAYDLGFLMSFFSVAACFIVYPPLSALLRKVMNDNIADYIAVSLSAQLGILPFVAAMYYGLNFLAFFANLLVVPLFGLMFPLLFVCVLVCAAIPFFGKLLVVFDFLFNVIFEIAKFFSQTSMKVGLWPFDALIIAVTCVIVFIISRFVMVEKLNKFMLVSGVSIMFVICALMNAFPPKWGASITSVMTNRSNSVLLTTSSNQRFLINHKLNTNTLNEFFYLNKVRSVDLAFSYSAPEDELVDYYSGYNTKSIITVEGDENALVHKISNGMTYQAGDFAFRLLDEENYFVLEINFDDIEFCFASTGKMSYTEEVEFLNSLQMQGYDFIYYGGSCFYRSGNDYKAQNYVSGNYRYEFKNEKFVLRGID